MPKKVLIFLLLTLFTNLFAYTASDPQDPKELTQLVAKEMSLFMLGQHQEISHPHLFTDLFTSEEVAKKINKYLKENKFDKFNPLKEKCLPLYQNVLKEFPYTILVPNAKLELIANSYKTLFLITGLTRFTDKRMKESALQKIYQYENKPFKKIQPNLKYQEAAYIQAHEQVANTPFVALFPYLAQNSISKYGYLKHLLKKDFQFIQKKNGIHLKSKVSSFLESIDEAWKEQNHLYQEYLKGQSLLDPFTYPDRKPGDILIEDLFQENWFRGKSMLERQTDMAQYFVTFFSRVGHTLIMTDDPTPTAIDISSDGVRARKMSFSSQSYIAQYRIDFEKLLTPKANLILKNSFYLVEIDRLLKEGAHKLFNEELLRSVNLYNCYERRKYSVFCYAYNSETLSAKELYKKSRLPEEDKTQRHLEVCTEFVGKEALFLIDYVADGLKIWSRKQLQLELPEKIFEDIWSPLTNWEGHNSGRFEAVLKNAIAKGWIKEIKKQEGLFVNE